MATSDLFRLHVDTGETRHWIEMIGRFMFNFGVIEMLSIWYVQHAATEELLVGQAISMQLGPRIKLVRQLITRVELSRTRRRELDELWSDVDRLLPSRNHLAHNPLMFGWRGEETGPPDFIGVPNLRKMGGSPGSHAVPSLTFDQLRQMADESSVTASRLHTILNELVKDRFAEPPPAVLELEPPTE